MTKKDKQAPLTQKDLRKLRQELSLELTRMSSDQKKEYFEAAKEVCQGLERMTKIANVVNN